jgi:hypothetical protein
VPQERDRLCDFINLRGRLTTSRVTLGDDGAIITEKMSTNWRSCRRQHHRQGRNGGSENTGFRDYENYVYKYVICRPLCIRGIRKNTEYKTFVGKIADTSKTAAGQLVKGFIE